MAGRQGGSIGRIGASAIVTIAAGLLLAACSSEQLENSEQGLRTVVIARQLTAEEVQKAIATQSEWPVTWSDGSSGSLAFGADGNVTIRIGDDSDSGPWRFEGRDFCATWPAIGGGEQCFRLFSKMWGDGMKMYRPDGTLAGSTDVTGG